MENYKNRDIESLYYILDGKIYLENWVDIYGYEGYYKISNLGRVKSIERKIPHSFSGYITIKEKILSQKVCKNGYTSVNLSLDTVHKMHYVHRLVASHFLINEENKKEVNHKYGDKSDNRFYMIEWATPSENQLHSYSELNRAKPCMLGNGNPNYGKNKYHLNIQTGIFYTFKELIKLFGGSYNFYKNKANNEMFLKNFIKV